MSPGSEGGPAPLSFKSSVERASSASLGGLGAGARALGLRESNQALAELKTKLEFALSRLNDQDTQRTGVEEIREFLQGLYPDWFPVVIGCIGEAGSNLKPLGRCESVKLLGLLAELHGDSVVPLLPRILQVVVTRLQDADLHLREACAETVFRLARALVTRDLENSQAFATLLKPLFGALGEHSKWVQIGAAACICSVIQGSPSSVISENLGRLCARLVQHLGLPLAMARPQLLSACIYAMQAVDGAAFDEALPSLMPCLETCLAATSDWQTRKQAIEVLQAVGDNIELGQSLDLPPPANGPAGPTPLQRRISQMLESSKTDKVRAVREAVKDVNSRWGIGKTTTQAGYASAAARSSSPCAASTWAAAEPGPSPLRTQARRSNSPTAAASASWSAGAAVGETRLGGASPLVTNTLHERSLSRKDFRPTVEEVLAPKTTTPWDSSDGVAEKAAARRTAVKEALSGAVLNSTKKPKVATRRSIFNGPANAGFFKSAALNVSTPPTSACGAEDRGGEAEFDDGQEMYYQEEQEPPGDDETGVSPLPSGANSPSASGAPAPVVPGTRVTRPEYSPSCPPEDSDADIRAEVVSNSSTSMASHRFVERNTGAYEEPCEDDEDAENLIAAAWMPSGGNAGNVQLQSKNKRGDRLRHDESQSRSAPSQKFGDGDIAHRVEALLDEKLRLMEDARLDSEERLAGRLRCLERTGDDQRGQIAALQKQVEVQEQRLQAQRQQLSMQEQCIQDLESRLATQEEQMENQELHINEQRLQLEEQQARLDKQEQCLEEQQQLLEEQNDRLTQQQSLLESTHDWGDADENATLQASGGITGMGPLDGKSSVRSMKPGQHGERPEGHDFDGITADISNTANGDVKARVAWDAGPAGSTSSRLAPAPLPVSQGTVEMSLSHRDSISSSVSVGSAAMSQAASGLQKKSTALWERVMDLCDAERYLDAYKQVIAEPEEVCLLKLMHHTGPIVDRLDAESNSRLIRRLIHILSPPAKEHATGSTEQIFSWLRQALDVGIHFTSSQVEDLVSALDKVAAPTSPLPAAERAEASRLLSRVSALRR